MTQNNIAFRRAKAMVTYGDLSAARRAFAELDSQDPTIAAWVAYCDYLLSPVSLREEPASRGKRAKLTLKRLAAPNPEENFEVLTLYAKVCHLAGETELARACLVRVLRMEPENADALSAYRALKTTPEPSRPRLGWLRFWRR